MSLRGVLLIAPVALSVLSCSAAALSGRDVSPPDSDDASPALTAAATAEAATAPALSPTVGTFAPSGPTEIALVNSITDGDTIWVDILGEESRVRYIGIDTPELGFDDRLAEAFAQEATTANTALVEDELVVLETDVSETDDFGRLLRYVWLAPVDTADTGAGAWRLVNLELVHAGLAEARAYPPDTKYSELLDAVESEARSTHRGMWSDE
jgi:endonuclease YncB( thermonuclease family)